MQRIALRPAVLVGRILVEQACRERRGGWVVGLGGSVDGVAEGQGGYGDEEVTLRRKSVRGLRWIRFGG